MKLVLYGNTLGDVKVVSPDAFVLCTDNKTPIAVVTNVGDNVCIETASDKGFNSSLKSLGLDLPTINVVDLTNAHSIR